MVYAHVASGDGMTVSKAAISWGDRWRWMHAWMDRFVMVDG